MLFASSAETVAFPLLAWSRSDCDEARVIPVIVQIAVFWSPGLWKVSSLESLDMHSEFHTVGNCSRVSAYLNFNPSAEVPRLPFDWGLIWGLCHKRCLPVKKQGEDFIKTINSKERTWGLELTSLASFGSMWDHSQMIKFPRCEFPCVVISWCNTDSLPPSLPPLFLVSLSPNFPPF